MPTASPAVRYRLKVSLRRISPMIWRRLLVPSDLTLHGLHRAIQIAFGWEDYHLHAFKAHGRRYGTEWTGQRHTVEDADDLRELVLADLKLRLRRKMVYEYDFGDSREHELRLEAREEADPRKPYPVCVGGARAGPPEDVGGPDGTTGCSSACTTCACGCSSIPLPRWKKTMAGKIASSRTMTTRGRWPARTASTATTTRCCATTPRPSTAGR